jgi:hypothetical protein
VGPSLEEIWPEPVDSQRASVLTEHLQRLGKQKPEEWQAELKSDLESLEGLIFVCGDFEQPRAYVQELKSIVIRGRGMSVWSGHAYFTLETSPGEWV